MGMCDCDLITKVKCPEGQHAHSGYTTCHSPDKPHRPGTTADLFHKQNGINNTWFEKHGTTREQYEKEHGGGDGGKDKPDKPKVDKPKIEKPKAEKPKEEEPPKDSGEDVPAHVDYPKIEYGYRSNDVPTDEAEWIFKQGSDMKVWDSRIKENEESIRSARDKISKLSFDAKPEEYFKAVTETEGLGFTYEDSAQNEGQAIWFNRSYKYANIAKLRPSIAKKNAEGFLKAKEKMYIPHKVKLGVMTSSKASGACWSNQDGSCDLRLEVSYMNYNPTHMATEKSCYELAGEYASLVPVHELTHAYINSMVYDLIDKGIKNGDIKTNGWDKGYYTRKCTLITHGDRVTAFSDSNCTESYSYAGRFTQTVVSDAQKVAKSLYGMDKDVFRSQMTAYGQTKAKEGIPEAVADVIINGDKATLANKLIYMSLQRYARFIYSDEKEIQPIGTYIKDLKAKQKDKGKKRRSSKSVKKQRYISFAELMELDI